MLITSMMLSLRSLWRLADELRTKVGGSSSGDARNDKIWAEIDCNGTENYTTSVSLSGVARKFSQRCVTTPIVSINRRHSLFLDYCSYCAVFIGVCTNCPLL